MKATKLHFCITIAVLVALAVGSPPLHTQATLANGVEPRGAAAMASFDRLPYFKTGTTIRQVSSFDRTGGNLDGAAPPDYLFRYLYRHPETGGYVVLDEAKPGTIYRIWVTGIPSGDGGNIRIYLDNETDAAIDLPVREFFSGSAAPFLSPLVGDDQVSPGAFYCYYPIAFREAARVEFSVLPSYYQITYHLYNTPDGVTTYTGTEDLSAVYTAWNNPSADPKDRMGNHAVSVGPFDLAPGETKVLLDQNGSGSLRSVVLSLPQLTITQYVSNPPDVPRGYDAATLDVLGSTFVEMDWDGESDPSVDVPIGFLFGVGSSGLGLVEALLMGSLPLSNTLYNYFPMPYGQSAKVCLVNRSDTTIVGASATLEYNPSPYYGLGAEAGYFTVVYNSETPLAKYRDYPLLDVPSGRGHVVGVVMDIQSRIVNALPRILEGDERIYIDTNVDGQDTRGFNPMIHGTGTEDFFNGGWYFAGGTLFTLPVHGLPLFYDRNDEWRMAMYRLCLADAMPFERRFAFTFEHGGENNTSATFKTAVFAYLVRGQPVLVQSDGLDVGNRTDEIAHGYSVSNVAGEGKLPLPATFVGRDGATTYSYTGTGRAHKGFSAFDVGIPAANDGVRLGRILDHGSANQKANVHVDGTLAGVWCTGGANAYHRALYDYFEIPPALTRGKSSIHVRIEFVDGTLGWTEYYYYAYSHVYPHLPTPTPTSSPTASHTPTGTATLTATPSLTATQTPTLTLTPTLTPTQVETATITPSPTATFTSTAEPSPSPSMTPVPTLHWCYLPIVPKRMGQR